MQDSSEQHAAVFLGIGFVAQGLVVVVEGFDRIIVAADQGFDFAVLVDDVSGDEHQNFGTFDGSIGGTEQTFKQRDLVDDRNGIQIVVGVFLDQTAQNHGLTVGDGHAGFQSTLAEHRLIGVGDGVGNGT